MQLTRTIMFKAWFKFLTSMFCKKPGSEKHIEVGLFHLFFTNQYFNIICQWANARLKENYNISISEAKFRAYVGFEMAMSIVSFNDIAEYWQREMYCGHKDFKNTMSRDDFMRIRSKLVFRPPEPVGHDVISNDPLWFGRKMLTIFHKNCAQTAVPVGTAALDENTAQTKARTRAKSYIPNKPDPYGIRFYAVVGWNPGTCLHSINDNRS